MMVNVRTDVQRCLVTNVGLAASVNESLHYDHTEGQSLRSVQATIKESEGSIPSRLSRLGRKGVGFDSQ